MMNKAFLKSTLVTALVALFLTGGLNAQEHSPMEVTRRIADKVIRETSFAYDMVPLTYNAGITRFVLEGSAPGVAGHIYYSSTNLHSDQETEGLLGFSFSGHIKVFLNGQEVSQDGGNGCGQEAPAALMFFSPGNERFQKPDHGGHGGYA